MPKIKEGMRWRAALVSSARGGVRAQEPAEERNERALARSSHPGLEMASTDPLRPRRVAVVFSGQGSEWLGMGAELVEASVTFQRAIVACERAMAPYIRWSLVDALRGGPAWSTEIDVVQPCIFAMQVGLWELWRELGMTPQGVVGHSIGEVAAAYASGALSLDAAAQVICRQSSLFRRAKGRGTLLYVQLPTSQLQTVLSEVARSRRESVTAAIEHSPSATVVVGPRPALDLVEQRLTNCDIDIRWIPVDVPAHTDYLGPECKELEAELAAGPFVAQAARLDFYSVAHGRRWSSPLDATYWRNSSTLPVRFVGTIQQMLQDGFDTFVELSPHPVVLAALEELVAERCGARAVVSSLRRRQAAIPTLLSNAAKLFCHGVSLRGVDLAAVAGSEASTDRDRQRAEARPRASAVSSPSASEGWLQRQVAQLTDAAAQLAAIREFVRQELAAAVGGRPGDVSLDATMQELGLDSAGALGLRKRLNQAGALQLPVSVTWRHPTAASLITHVHAMLIASPPTPRRIDAAPLVVPGASPSARSASLAERLQAEIARSERLLQKDVLS